MANQLTGKVLSISPAISINTRSGNPFVKRELVLDCTRYDAVTGERMGYDNYVAIEFTQKNTALLDGLLPGQVVTVAIDIQGRKYEGGYINSVRGYKVEVRQTRAHQQQPATQQPTYQQPQQHPLNAGEWERSPF